MANVSLRQYAARLGSNSVREMARRSWGDPYFHSVRKALGLQRVNLPLAPVDLQPQNGAQNVAHDPFLFWRDPGAGTDAAALDFSYLVSQNGNVVGDFRGRGFPEWHGPPPPNLKWEFPLPSGEVTLTVHGRNSYGVGPESKSTFTVGAAPPPVEHSTTIMLQAVWPFGLCGAYQENQQQPVVLGTVVKIKNESDYEIRVYNSQLYGSFKTLAGHGTLEPLSLPGNDVLNDWSAEVPSAVCQGTSASPQSVTITITYK